MDELILQNNLHKLMLETKPGEKEHITTDKKIIKKICGTFDMDFETGERGVIPLKVYEVSFFMKDFNGNWLYDYSEVFYIKDNAMLFFIKEASSPRFSLLSEDYRHMLAKRSEEDVFNTTTMA